MMLIRTAGESVKFIGSKYIQESLINTTPNRPDYFLFFFARKSGKSVDQSEQTFISKQKQTTSLHQGWQWALKIAVWKILQLSADHHAEWPLCKLWELCFSVPDLVYLPLNKPILDIPKSETSIVYRIPTENGPWIPNWRSSSTAYPDGRHIFVRTAETTFFLFSLIICFFCCQSRIVVGLVVSESRVPSLYFLGGIFTR